MTTKLTLCLLLTLSIGLAFGQSRNEWLVFGRDVSSSHYNPDVSITPANISHLKQRWVFKTGGDVSSQPIVADGVVYFGSWDGKEYAVDAKTGAKVWEFDVGVPSRSAAAYGNGALYFGDTAGRLYALDAKNGSLKWKIRLDEHSATMSTSSPILYQGRIYTGVSSREEIMSPRPDYKCCTFRGSVVAIDAATGKEVWRFRTIPDEPVPQGKDKRGRDLIGPSGGAIWSTVTLDPAAKRVYVGTGNQYTGPAAKYTNSILTLDMDNGKLIWSYQATPKDLWTLDCKNDPDCLDLDFDFGMAPVFFKGPGGKRLVGAGQKSGWCYGLDVTNGSVVWKTEVGPGGKLGGIEFGGASDGERVYVAISNHPGQGSVSALDGATGKILWQTLNPDGKANFGPITVTGQGNDRLVWAGSGGGFIRAYNAATGKIVWEADTGGAVGGGPTVVGDTLYVGSGYNLFRLGKTNDKLFAFSLSE